MTRRNLLSIIETVECDDIHIEQHRSVEGKRIFIAFTPLGCKLTHKQIVHKLRRRLHPQNVKVIEPEWCEYLLWLSDQPQYKMNAIQIGMSLNIRHMTDREIEDRKLAKIMRTPAAPFAKIRHFDTAEPVFKPRQQSLLD